MIIKCKKCGDDLDVLNKRTKYHKECVEELQRERCRQYKQNHRVDISKYNEQYKKDFKDYISQYNKNYQIKNREQSNIRHKKVRKERILNDDHLKNSERLRNKVRRFILLESNGLIADLICCSQIELRKWFEYLFKSDMSWENYGKLWHIDHVVPCCLFDLAEYEDQKICFNWKNLRPLYASQNYGRKYSLKDILHHELKVNHFIKNNKNYENHNIFNYQVIREIR